jgi:hypothetical protein
MSRLLHSTVECGLSIRTSSGRDKRLFQNRLSSGAESDSNLVYGTTVSWVFLVSLGWTFRVKSLFGFNEKLSKLFVAGTSTIYDEEFVLRNVFQGGYKIRLFQRIVENCLSVQTHRFFVLVFNTTIVFYKCPRKVDELGSRPVWTLSRPCSMT